MLKAIIAAISGFLFLGSMTSWLLVRIFMKPGADSDLDDYYWEFEDQHPAYAKYSKLSKLCFTIAAISVLLLFIATFI